MAYVPTNELIFTGTYTPDNRLVFGPRKYTADLAATLSPLSPDLTATALYKTVAVADIAATVAFAPVVTVTATTSYSEFGRHAYLNATLPSISTANVTATAFFGKVNLASLAVTLPQLSSATFHGSATERLRQSYSASLAVTLQALTPPTFHGTAFEPTLSSAFLAVTLPPLTTPTFTTEAIAKSNVSRQMSTVSRARYTVATRVQPTVNASDVNSQPIPHVQMPLSIDGFSITESHTERYRTDVNHLVQSLVPTDTASGVATLSSSVKWSWLERVDSALRMASSIALSSGRQIKMPYQHLAAVMREWDERWDKVLSIGQHCDQAYSPKAKAQREMGIIYTLGSPLTPGVHILVPTPVPYVAPIKSWSRRNILRFSCPAQHDNILRFNPLCGNFTVPIQRTYIVANSFSLVRADTGSPLYATTFSISIDSGSWTWTWSTKVHGKQIADVLSSDPLNPMEVVATINGTAFKLVVEKITRDRSFGSDILTISGRGLSCYLSAPYVPITTVFSSSAITAQQVANLALQNNGVSIGWDVNWNITDWLIAGSAFSSTGTYIEHLQRIAEAGGGYLQPTPSSQAITFMPYYPVAPWDWSTQTPDLVLPEDVVTVESIEYVNKTAYNSIYINGGSSGGRLDFIKRTGTSGDYPALTIVDPLATDSAMTTQRGLRVLGDTGQQATVALTMPILPTTGIILPGQLLRYTVKNTNYLGLVRSVAVTYDMPKVRQVVTVETHL